MYWCSSWTLNVCHYVLAGAPNEDVVQNHALNIALLNVF